MSLEKIVLPVEKDEQRRLALTAGRLSCLYENGFLRDIRMAGLPALSMIYPAVRDHNWATAPYRIREEQIESGEDSFRIHYKALFEMHRIRYEAEVWIEGSSDDQIRFRFHGKALSSFLRNRIGLCVHHPIRSCGGRLVLINHPDGSAYVSEFPRLISPNQPFLDIRTMEWGTDGEGRLELLFEGDVFETEDQRNWTDCSYKTYSTPLSRPFPVEITAGEEVRQSVLLKALVLPEPSFHPDDSAEAGIREHRLAFPRIGYARSTAKAGFSEEERAFLSKVPFDHYRVEVQCGDAGWQEELRSAAKEASALKTRLELAVLFSAHPEEDLHQLEAVLEEIHPVTGSLLVLQEGHPTAPAGLSALVYRRLKPLYPGLLIGYGTAGFFAELNRNRPAHDDYDFVSFPLNPQVHLTDRQTIIENAEAQQYTLETLRSFLPREKQIFVSPVTMKIPTSALRTSAGGARPSDTMPPDADPRQQTWWAAAWTLLSISFLGGADQVTYYETVGAKGIILDGEALPVYKVLEMIRNFNPVWVVRRVGSSGFEGVMLEDKEGGKLYFDLKGL